MPDEKFPLSSETCLARAMQCEELAEQTTIAVTKAILLDIAKHWRALAAESERPSFRPIGRALGAPSLR